MLSVKTSDYAQLSSVTHIVDPHDIHSPDTLYLFVQVRMMVFVGNKFP